MVKYADGPQTEVEIDIAVPPEVVWPLVCDINTPSAFSVEFQRAEWIDDGPGPGARFRGYNKHSRVGEWSVECTITDFVEGAVFEWSVGEGADRAARWRFELTSTTTGSHLRFGAEMGPGRSGLTPAIEAMPEREDDIVAGRLNEWTDNMRATAEGIKGLAEDVRDRP
ncbi:MAG: SRPBCC family protein [Actinomycetota bacterium]